MSDKEILDDLSPQWKRPDEVLRRFKIKQKKRALSSRISGNDNVTGLFSNNSNSEDSVEYPLAKRRNPFAAR